jgi:hypothetical protein
VRRLGAAYEQINASFGQFSLDTLRASTTALKATDDATYASIEDQIADLTADRDALAARIKEQLAEAVGGDRPGTGEMRAEITAARRLLDRAHELAAAS